LADFFKTGNGQLERR